jgi:PAS domain S-box-containing protein
MRRYIQRPALGNKHGPPAAQAQAAELVTARPRHELLLNSIDEGIYTLDRQGRITYVNTAAARMLGWEAEELIGELMHARLHHAQADGKPYPPGRNPIIATLRDGTVQQSAHDVFWRKDGIPLPVEYVASPIADAGTIAGAIVICRDISDRRRLEAQLIQAQKLESIGRLAGGIAHDFNNMLAIIQGCVELAIDALPDVHGVQADLRAIRDATDRAAALTGRLMSFARKQATAPQIFSLNDMLYSIEPLLRRILGSSVALELRLAADLALLRADFTQIEQVLLNLAVNARDAMPDGGRLTIETATIELDSTSIQHAHMNPGRYVTLSVSDTGPGIPPEIQAQIFDAFFTTKRDGTGTGLGLWASYGIVQQHGGTIGVSSEVGQGATFKVYLPCAEAETSAPDASAAVLSRGSETILLVDDQEPPRALAAHTLREHGYIVIEATTGEAGLKLAQNHAGPLDLLLADIVLPELGGTELAERIAAMRPGIKIVLVSDEPEHALIYQGRMARERLVLRKPFAAPSLLHAVRSALDH